MTDTIRQHEPVNGICPHCGTNEPFNERTCISRDANTKNMSPEPKERSFAVYDSDTISRRLGELRAERDVINASAGGAVG